MMYSSEWKIIQKWEIGGLFESERKLLYKYRINCGKFLFFQNLEWDANVPTQIFTFFIGHKRVVGVFPHFSLVQEYPS